MLAVAAQNPTFIVMDALDECPTYFGTPTPRSAVLNLLKDLNRLHIPNLRICVTSRPECDILTELGPLAPHRISLHDQIGHKTDIVHFVESVVRSDGRMRKWRPQGQNLVIDSLSERADGM